VLELGAASGGNLIPMAYELPHSQFIGVDLSSRQVAEGQSTIDAIQLTNIELRHLGIADIGSEFGRFDYIICHGVYSWVPDAVRDSILSVCRDHLAPNGVAFLSYNTYPGWHMRGMIRDMMRFHAGRFNEPQAQIDQARSLLNFLATSVSVDTPYGVMLRRELDGLQRQPDSYLFHEHLEEVNSPLYFFQIAQEIEKHGLQYLGEADFSTMLAGNFQPKVAEVLQRVASDIIHMEQYMDFLRNRTFRQTLLVRRERVLRRNLTSANVKPFYIACPARPVSATPDIRSGTPEEFRMPNGLMLKTSHPMTKAAMVVMAEHWPQPLHFDQICADAHGRLNPDGNQELSSNDSAVEILAGEMLSAYTAGMVELRPRGLLFSRQISPRPMASRLARLQAQTVPNGRVINLRHEPVMLDELQRQVLQRLDGNHDRQGLLNELVDLVPTGALNIEQSGKRVSDPSALRPLLEGLIEEALSTLASMALLERQSGDQASVQNEQAAF
jgi:methyltransferase-like protein/SAM-dependent methyltransferase